MSNSEFNELFDSAAGYKAPRILQIDPNKVGQDSSREVDVYPMPGAHVYETFGFFGYNEYQFDEPMEWVRINEENRKLTDGHRLSVRATLFCDRDRLHTVSGISCFKTLDDIAKIAESPIGGVVGEWAEQTLALKGMGSSMLMEVDGNWVDGTRKDPFPFHSYVQLVEIGLSDPSAASAIDATFKAATEAGTYARRVIKGRPIMPWSSQAPHYTFGPVDRPHREHPNLQVYFAWFPKHQDAVDCNAAGFVEDIRKAHSSAIDELTVTNLSVIDDWG